MWESYEDLHQVMKNLWTDRDSINVMEFERIFNVYKGKLANPTLQTNGVSNNVGELQEGKVEYKGNMRNIPINIWGAHIQVFSNDTGLSYIDSTKLFLEVQDKLYNEDAMLCVSNGMMSKVVNEAYILYHKAWSNQLNSLSELFSLELSLYIDMNISDDHPLFVCIHEKTGELLKGHLLQQLCGILVRLHTTTPLYYKQNHYTLTRSITSLLYNIITSVCRPLVFLDLSLIYNTQCDLIRLLNSKEHPGSHLFVSVVMLETCTLSCLQVKSSDLLSNYNLLQNQYDIYAEQHGEKSAECQNVSKQMHTLRDNAMTTLDAVFNLSKRVIATDVNQIHGHTLRLGIAIVVSILEPILSSPIELSVVEPMVESFLQNKGALRYWHSFLLQIPHQDAHPQYMDAINSVGYLLVNLFTYFGHIVHKQLSLEERVLVDPASTPAEVKETCIYWILGVSATYISEVPALASTLMACPEFVSLLYRTLHSNNSYSSLYNSGNGMQSVDMTIHSPLFLSMATLLGCISQSGHICAEEVYKQQLHSTKFTLDFQLKKVYDQYLLQTSSYSRNVKSVYSNGDMKSTSQMSYTIVGEVCKLIAGLAGHQAALSAVLKFTVTGGQNVSFQSILCGFLNLRCPLVFKKEILHTLGAIARSNLDATLEVLRAFTSVYIPALSDIRNYTPKSGTPASNIYRGKSCGVSLGNTLKQTVPHNINILEAQTYMSNPSVCSASTIPSLNCTSIFYALTQNSSMKNPMSSTNQNEEDNILAESFIQEIVFHDHQDGDLTAAFLVFVQSLFLAFQQYPRRYVLAELTHKYIEETSTGNNVREELHNGQALLPVFVDIIMNYIYLVRPLRKNTSVHALVDTQDTCLRVLTTVQEVYSFLTRYEEENQALQCQGSLHAVYKQLLPAITKTRACIMVKLITRSNFYENLLRTVQASYAAINARDVENYENNQFSYSTENRTSQLIEHTQHGNLSGTHNNEIFTYDIQYTSVLLRIIADKDVINKYNYKLQTQGKVDPLDAAKFSQRTHSLEHTCLHCLNSLDVITLGTSVRAFESVLESVLTLLDVSYMLSNNETEVIQGYNTTTLLKNPVKLLQQCMPNALKDQVFLSGYKHSIDNYSSRSPSLHLSLTTKLQQQVQIQAITFHQVLGEAIVSKDPSMDLSSALHKQQNIDFLNGHASAQLLNAASTHCTSLLRRDVYSIAKHASRIVFRVMNNRGGDRFFAMLECNKQETSLLQQMLLQNIQDIHRSDCVPDSEEVLLLQSILLPSLHEQMVTIHEQDQCGNSIAADTGVITVMQPDSTNNSNNNNINDTALVEVETLEIPYTVLHNCMNTITRSIRYQVCNSTSALVTGEVVFSTFDDVMCIQLQSLLQILTLGVSKNVPFLVQLLGLDRQREVLQAICTLLSKEHIHTSHPSLCTELLHLFLQLQQSEHRHGMQEFLQTQDPFLFVKILCKIPVNYVQVLVENEYCVPYEPLVSIPLDHTSVFDRKKYLGINLYYKNMQFYLALQKKLTYDQLIQYITSGYGQVIATVFLSCFKLCGNPDNSRVLLDCQQTLQAFLAKQEYYGVLLKDHHLGYQNNFHMDNEFVNTVGISKTTLTNMSYLDLVKPFYCTVTCTSSTCACSVRNVVGRYIVESSKCAVEGSNHLSGFTSEVSGSSSMTSLLPWQMCTCELLHEVNCYGVKNVISLLSAFAMSISKNDVVYALRILSVYKEMYFIDDVSNTMYTRDAILSCMVNTLHIFVTIADGTFASLLQSHDKSFSMNGFLHDLIHMMQVTKISTLRMKLYSLFTMFLQANRENSSNLSGVGMFRSIFTQLQSKQSGSTHTYVQNIDATIKSIQASSKLVHNALVLSKIDLHALVDCIACDGENSDMNQFTLVASFVCELYRAFDNSDFHTLLYNKWLHVCNSMILLHSKTFTHSTAQVIKVLYATCLVFGKYCQSFDMYDLLTYLIQPMCMAFVNNNNNNNHIQSNNTPMHIVSLENTLRCILLSVRNTKNVDILVKVIELLQQLHSSCLSYLLQRDGSAITIYTLSIMTRLNKCHATISATGKHAPHVEFCSQLNAFQLYNSDRWVRGCFTGANHSHASKEGNGFDLVTFTTCLVDFLYSYKALNTSNIVNIRNTFGDFVPSLLQFITRDITSYTALNTLLQSTMSVLEKENSVPSFLLHNITNVVNQPSNETLKLNLSYQINVLTGILSASSTTTTTTTTKNTSNNRTGKDLFESKHNRFFDEHNGMINHNHTANNNNSSTELSQDTQQKNKQASSLCNYIKQYICEKTFENILLAEKLLIFIYTDVQHDRQVRNIWTSLLQSKDNQDMKRVRMDDPTTREVPQILTDILRAIAQATDSLHLQNTGFSKTIVDKLVLNLRK